MKENARSIETVALPELPVTQLRRDLRQWYAESGRRLPWRERDDPYLIWVSEIMLQQTQVKTVIPYYQNWLSRFPDLATLAKADLQDVLKAWQGLGYYARARNLHKAAGAVVRQHGGIFPQQLDDVLALPGIGRSTAGGILSAAFNQPVSILDGNVKRVLSRLIALSVPPAKALPQLWQLSDTLLDRENPRDFNQALMDLGATLCTPKNPGCLLCPWRTSCKAYNLEKQSEIPMRETRFPLPHKHIGVAVIWNDRQQLLIDRRLDSGLLGGLWEFPGGKIEPGETIEACIAREIQEELGIEVEVGERLITVEHAYTHFRVTLNVHHCRHLHGEPQAIECQEVRWVTLEEIDRFPFPKANTLIIEALREFANGEPTSAPIRNELR
ncbi:MAG TPA: A/G-specific adenine glycosylase [Oscillatoriales cyanobacterium M59_W2019_021]|nr:MAG: A/G-specific adenine glycosylase [Cyanobacteria bacterium J055]HIK30854.1 A/G-specific adenine glycosylase [Oscillatoriales cyanobacterium M4454_W2019_049]HIK52433.1 A/G-specific adenine glycosylase [Oscillatoriales cyanobacterium M59_W2019_021]